MSSGQSTGNTVKLKMSIESLKLRDSIVFLNRKSGERNEEQ
jgi:hypothetical protein